MQLHPGMKRETLEAVLQPLPYPYPEISISGTIGVQYLVRPGVWVDVKYLSDGSLAFRPEQLFVRASGIMTARYKSVRLSEIQ
jgi:hypothetical protein